MFIPQDREAKQQARYGVITKGGEKIHALVQVCGFAPFSWCYLKHVLSVCLSVCLSGDGYLFTL